MLASLHAHGRLAQTPQDRHVLSVFTKEIGFTDRLHFAVPYVSSRGS